MEEGQGGNAFQSGVSNPGFSGAVTPQGGGLGSNPPSIAQVPRETGDIVLAPEKKKGGKKWLWVMVGVVITVVVVVVFGLLMATRANNNNGSSDNEEILTLLGWVPYTRQCNLVIEDADNRYRNVSDYDEQLEKCRDEAAKIEEQLSKLGNSDIDRELKTEVESYVVFGDELERDLKAYRAWHGWILNTDYLSYYQTDADIDELVEPLLESGNDVLVKYGEEWAEYRKDLVEAYLFDKTNYNQELATFNKLVQAAPDIDSLTSIGEEKDNSNLVQAMNDAMGEPR